MRKIRYFVIIGMLMLTTIASIQVIAHPPQDMVLNYDIESEQLDVTITHITPAPSAHYVNRVRIDVNDAEIINQEYDSQPDTEEYTLSFDLVADIGDEITVTAICNIQGSITRSITVRDPEQDEAPVVEIVNPTEGYFHFSGIRLFPSLGIVSNTLGFGGFRLTPLQFYTEDDIDDSSDLIVTAFINDEELGVAEYNSDNENHEIKWTGPRLGTFTLSVTAEDTTGNIGEDEMQVWYFCFIP